MRAKKHFGQNFLQDTRVIEQIVDALALEPGDRVIEIGPGEGALTAAILNRSAELTAIEIDRDLTPVLSQRFGSHNNFRLVEGDILSMDLAEMPRGGGRMKLVGNLPYYISTPIIDRLISSPLRFERLVIMLQREVVDRITAPAGSGDRGYFTVLVENAFDAEKLLTVPPGAFRPAPAVHSAVVRLTSKERLIADDGALRSLLSVGFAQKRKTLLNNLRRITPNAEDWLLSAGIEPSRRAETLTLLEWKKLSEVFEKANRPW